MNATFKKIWRSFWKVRVADTILSTIFYLMIFCCDSNLDLQSNLPRLGAWVRELTSFFFWKLLDIILDTGNHQSFVLLYKRNVWISGNVVWKTSKIFCHLLLFTQNKFPLQWQFQRSWKQNLWDHSKWSFFLLDIILDTGNHQSFVLCKKTCLGLSGCSMKN